MQQEEKTATSKSRNFFHVHEITKTSKRFNKLMIVF